jgi:hypothetical protein
MRSPRQLSRGPHPEIAVGTLFIMVDLDGHDGCDRYRLGDTFRFTRHNTSNSTCGFFENLRTGEELGFCWYRFRPLRNEDR